MSLEWMAWTLPTATFFIVIALILVAMTVWEVLSPTVARRGFLPIVTTRGDRLFISLLTSGYIHLAWLGLTSQTLWWATLISVLWFMVLMRWG